MQCRSDKSVRCCIGATLLSRDHDLDLAILKISSGNSNGIHEFPFLDITESKVPIGTPVYSYGYPICSESLTEDCHFTGKYHVEPRVASAIVSAYQWGSDGEVPESYIIDRPLLCGNSGGPLVMTESGRVVAFASQSQSDKVAEFKSPFDGTNFAISVPSPYSYCRNFGYPSIQTILREHGITIHSD